MNDMKKLFWAIFIGMLIRLYTTFVAQNLWNWFAVDTFHASSISFFVMYGLLLLVDLIVEKPEHEEGYRWAMLSTAVDFCIPDEKREAVEQAMENLTNEHKVMIWINAGTYAVGRVIGNTITLGLGFVVHILAS